jgi:hypothetical protein
MRPVRTYRQYEDRGGSRGGVEMQTPAITEIYRDQEPEGEPEAPSCRHHWIIESPHGATSMGRCKICDEIKEFRNSASDTVWEGDPMSSISKMGGGSSRPVVREAAPTLSHE